MDVALDVSGMLLSWNIDPVVLQAMAWGFGAILGGLAIVWTVVYIAILVLMIVSYWKIFEKAGQPWRGVFIPFYNIYLMLKVAGRPGARLRWLLLPPVFGILMIVTIFDLTKRFWKHRAFGIGILLLPFIFIPILAFDKSIIYTPKQ
jgi:hypothetical protein